MGMRSQHERAVYLVVCGLALIASPAVPLLGDPKARPQNPGALVPFFAVTSFIGVFLCMKGCSRLRDLKRSRPDQTWLQVLGKDLIVIAVVTVALLAVLLMPEASQHALAQVVQVLHDLEGSLAAARGGPP
jgi:hypothetical protein